MIDAIIFSIFDPKEGPRLVYQNPNNYLSKAIFDNNHFYIITKPLLQGHTITLALEKKYIIGHPLCLKNSKYDRNMFMFNVCFIIKRDMDIFPFEKVVKKLSNYLKRFELEDAYLSESKNKLLFFTLLKDIRFKLNMYGMCSLSLGNGKMIHLKLNIENRLFNIHKINDYDVPIMIENNKLYNMKFDLSMQQILLHINSYNHILKISQKADVDKSLVILCIKNLMYIGIIKLLSIFQYSNVYTCLPDIHKLFVNKHLQNECLKYVSINENKQPQLHDVLLYYSAFNHTDSIQNINEVFNPRLLKFNEKKLIQFGLVHGLISPVKKYPILINSKYKFNFNPGIQNKNDNRNSLYNNMLYIDGRADFDGICCKNNISHKDLDLICKKFSNIIIFYA
ncbi:unnamed protein product [Gordionus sp. m RMFG-2023]|uniref:GATOR1 complex protein NPRL2-like isoform X3 n=1 Tax=Gordionus sp. m RMFG-2023 TaxID=3053472 RepID=UPI0030E25EB6